MYTCCALGIDPHVYARNWTSQGSLYFIVQMAEAEEKHGQLPFTIHQQQDYLCALSWEEKFLEEVFSIASFLQHSSSKLVIRNRRGKVWVLTINGWSISLLVGFQYATISKYQTCVSATGCESTVISVSSLLETGCSRLTAASINSPDKLCMTWFKKSDISSQK